MMQFSAVIASSPSTEERYINLKSAKNKPSEDKMTIQKFKTGGFFRSVRFQKAKGIESYYIFICIFDFYLFVFDFFRASACRLSL
jgi:hypothetical protein